MLARMASGMANDLASTVLLATDKPVLVAPSMNVRMWQHAATQANVAALRQRGVAFVGPEDGDMACGEYGPGRLSEPLAIVAAIAEKLAVMAAPRPLQGLRALVTSGPTHEPIDPVRYIANRSSGKQGHAIAAALAAAGAEVVLVTGPVALPNPPGVTVQAVETARQMQAACTAALPVDIAICAAAVADWGVQAATGKIKKQPGTAPAPLALVENPDILAGLAQHASARPRLVIGFAAETENLLANARAKRARKGCDWILANDVAPGTTTFGGEANQVTLVSAAAEEAWPVLDKSAVAARLAARIADYFHTETKPKDLG
jgi:phosphopantothenoylcysteine decarboxylase / phosphopantothenate---cysteine ligase